MDFRVTEDQEALREGLRTFCDGRVPIETLRELEQKPELDRALWGELAEMGVFALRLPEDEGGVGLGMSDAAIAFIELGRRLVPGPLVWSQLAAGLVDGAATGQTVVGGLDLISHPDAPYVIEYFESLDVVLLLQPDGIYRVDPDVLSAKPVATPLDPLTPVHHVASLLDGQRIGGADDAAKLHLEGATLTAALMLGIAESTQELATEYAKSREQFGRAIAGFQTIKHILADMFVRQEVARAAVYAAGATLDDPEVGDVVRAVSAAKATAGEGAMRNSRDCIQVHGGMGYTWEVPAHYYLKRTWVLENVFGTVGYHEERIADLLASD
ncbi:MAG: acyl-CoA/acyl-ACP dehydrogenase [Deltaproteobacteria bacterium]|nr:acyl-CoA/acyl-ACP dehydrogenase [Deltaproteobacteria bacterium]MBW2445580.1 acyl-CoA/acyl-ACP dehydrogenase [Deltaproteobacteria bacterium]